MQIHISRRSAANRGDEPAAARQRHARPLGLHAGLPGMDENIGVE